MLHFWYKSHLNAAYVHRQLSAAPPPVLGAAAVLQQLLLLAVCAHVQLRPGEAAWDGVMSYPHKILHFSLPSLQSEQDLAVLPLLCKTLWGVKGERKDMKIREKNKRKCKRNNEKNSRREEKCVRFFPTVFPRLYFTEVFHTSGRWWQPREVGGGWYLPVLLFPTPAQAFPCFSWSMTPQGWLAGHLQSS